MRVEEYISLIRDLISDSKYAQAIFEMDVAIIIYPEEARFYYYRGYSKLGLD